MNSAISGNQQDGDASNQAQRQPLAESLEGVRPVDLERLSNAESTSEAPHKVEEIEGAPDMFDSLSEEGDWESDASDESMTGEDVLRLQGYEPKEDEPVPGPDYCSFSEVQHLKKELLRLGRKAFFEQIVVAGVMSAKKLCTAFGIRPPEFLEGQANGAYLNLLVMLINDYWDEQTRRPRLEQYKTVDDAIKLLQESKNIIVLTGAGISTSLGIPDFRSPDTGLYARLAHLGLSDPQEVFSLELFREDPSIFFQVAKDILPSHDKYTPTHGFIKLLQDKDKLLRNYTQNIDNIEANAGIDRLKTVQCHGSFATATCQTCRDNVDGEVIFDTIKQGSIPQCQRCKSLLDEMERPGMKRKRSSNHKSKKKNNWEDESDDSEDDDVPSAGIMKPDITFFGEDLPRRVDECLAKDKDEVDLIVVIGTSLRVAPVGKIPDSLPHSVPCIYISRDPINHVTFDITLLGDCDVVVAELCRRAGWDLKHDMIPKDQKVDSLPYVDKKEALVENIHRFVVSEGDVCGTRDGIAEASAKAEHAAESAVAAIQAHEG